MGIVFACSCGKKLRVKEELSGRRVRCPGCGEPVRVPATDAGSQALDLPVEEPEEKEPRPKRRHSKSDLDGHVPPSAKKPAKKKRRASKRDSGGRWSGIAVHPSIISGVLMMLGAVVWFALGYAAGRIYVYPPVLFVLGIGAVINGFRGTD